MNVEASKKIPEENRRKEHLLSCDTIIVSSKEENFNKIFMGEKKWYPIRVGEEMRSRIRYAAVYQTVPVGAITFIAEVAEVTKYPNSKKYQLIFKGEPTPIGPITIRDRKHVPQSPIYVQYEKLKSAKVLEDALPRLQNSND